MRFLHCLFLFNLFACKVKNEGALHNEQQLINIDMSFSASSKQNGMNAAFLHYMDKECVLLRPGHSPIIGYKAIDFIGQNGGSTFSITWQPNKEFISQSNNL